MATIEQACYSRILLSETKAVSGSIRECVSGLNVKDNWSYNVRVSALPCIDPGQYPMPINSGVLYILAHKELTIDLTIMGGASHTCPKRAHRVASALHCLIFWTMTV